jgi:cyclopropane fatty-acyl-phospholipid synthase-like methyltransferase
VSTDRADRDPADRRRAFLGERRLSSQHRYTTLYSATYDQDWGAISSSHERFLLRFLTRVPTGGTVLDAACGTGKYWPTLFAAGLAVTGIDQSAGMLAAATAKHPHVATRQIALQDLTDQVDLHAGFDALICIDALENVGPEDWPEVTTGLAAMLRPGAAAYLTVELPQQPLPAPLDPRQVPGEDFDGVGYHYYPTRDDVRRWLTRAGFTVTEQANGDDYWHLILTRD